MSLLQAIVLGIIQGLGEFLPISSSAHLVIIPWLLKWQEHTLAFDVALHFGTLIALCIYFIKDYTGIIAGTITKPVSEKGKLFLCIIAASIPAAVFGLLLEDIAENVFRKQYLLIALAMIVFSIVIFVIDKFRKKERELTGIKIIDALIIGISQVLALFPGVSRSGITMTSGLLLGFKRDQAARFSFLLSAPIIFGATMISFIKNIDEIKSELTLFIAGTLSAAAVGFIVIHFLLNYLKKRSFLPFIIYRILFGAVIIIAYFNYKV